MTKLGVNPPFDHTPRKVAAPAAPKPAAPAKAKEERLAKEKSEADMEEKRKKDEQVKHSIESFIAAFKMKQEVEKTITEAEAAHQDAARVVSEIKKKDYLK